MYISSRWSGLSGWSQTWYAELANLIAGLATRSDDFATLWATGQAQPPCPHPAAAHRV
ncbi:hypothetical protein [Nocardia farcinica]|uniref:hypothetical protein n=1 Tax=Nocardia farcinica TaxID=37329 RepID=UPI001E294313|nr:hypothetical protein [Nocardia farcinica]UEX22086.1 hypothetical protein LMJ57_24415 [Nocardia farcinica]